MAWIADVLHFWHGVPCEDFPEVETFVKTLTDRGTTHSLLNRFEAFEEIRSCNQIAWLLFYSDIQSQPRSSKLDSIYKAIAQGNRMISPVDCRCAAFNLQAARR